MFLLYTYIVTPWYDYPSGDVACRSPQTEERSAGTCTLDSHGDWRPSCLARDCQSTTVSSSSRPTSAETVQSSHENGSVTCGSSPLKDTNHSSSSIRLRHILKPPSLSVGCSTLANYGSPPSCVSKPHTTRTRRQMPNSHHSAVPAFLTDAHSFKKTVRALQGAPCEGFDSDSEAPTSDLLRSPQKSLSRTIPKPPGPANPTHMPNPYLRVSHGISF